MDQEIQQSTWANRKWDDARQCYTLSALDEIVHLLARSCFDKRAVTNAYQSRIRQLVPRVNETELEHRLSLVFFQASEPILSALKDDKISEIPSKLFGLP